MSVKLLDDTYTKNSQGRKYFPDITESATPWVRNANWISMPSIGDNEQKVAILVAVFNSETNWVSFLCQGNYTVDWGDGTTENFNGGVQCSHNYDYTDADLNNSHPDYKQALIIITPQSGQNLTTVQLLNKATGLQNNYNTTYLDLKISCPNLNNFSLGWPAATASTKFPLLERITIQKCGGSGGYVWNYANAFAYLENLRRIEFDPNTTFSTLQQLFQGCHRLQEFPESFTLNSNCSATSAFADCRQLTRMPQLINLQNVTNWSSTFQNCWNLRYTYPITETNSSITTYAFMFQYCYSLETAPYIKFNTSANSTASNMFDGCYNLSKIPSYDTSRVTNMNSMFQNCNSLRSVPYLDMSIVTTSSLMFFNCNSLTEIKRVISSSTNTTMNGIFYNCYSLTSVPALDFSKTTTAANLFTNCRSLQAVGDIDISSATTASSMFDSCSNLKTIASITTTTALTNTGNMLTTCGNLESVPLFTTSNVTTASSMFSSCYKLTTIPAFNFGNATTVSSMFSNCYNLTSLPSLDFSKTTTSGCSNLFTSCYSMREVTNITFNSASQTISYISGFSSLGNLRRISVSNVNANFNISNCGLGATALNEVYTNLSATGTGKTITVTGNWGTASDNPAIATAKGWTVTG